jgi:hypothetical protein
MIDYTRKMCWKDTGERLELHLYDSGVWIHYKRSSLAVPDYNIPGGSKGYATMQALLKQGWEVIPYPPGVISGTLSMDSQGRWGDDDPFG